MTPEETAERTSLEAVSELQILVGLAAGNLHTTLRKLGIAEKLDDEKEGELDDALIQAFIDFSKRCEVPYAWFIPPLTPRRSKQDRGGE
jgi:hypothetical protein